LKDLNKGNLIKIIKKFKGKRVLVLGDFILDEYVFGLTSRVSREAPVLILKYDNTEYGLGGAANAVNNLVSLGISVYPLGVLGDDDAGHEILRMLKGKNISTEGLILDKDMVTVKKTRIMAGGKNIIKQQVIRIDKENNKEISNDLVKKLLKIVSSQLDQIDGILVSDYGYGLCKKPELLDLFSRYSKNGGIVNVDSRFDLLKFKNVTTTTPNESEIEEIFGQKFEGNTSKIKKIGMKLLESISLKFLLITRGSKGMLILFPDGSSHSIPIFGSDRIVDVTGAGDTVISILTSALCSGATPIEATHLANIAGGLVVMKSGTATVTQSELLSAMKKYDRC
jgi:D-glycero-beta-D-manno-heptose-7-phosphate kinase